MQLTTTNLDSWSMPSSTMNRSINYKDTLFEWANLTSIRGEPNFETLHKLQNKIKENTKYVYFNLVGWAHGHLVLVLTN